MKLLNRAGALALRSVVGASLALAVSGLAAAQAELIGYWAFDGNGTDSSGAGRNVNASSIRCSIL